VRHDDLLAFSGEEVNRVLAFFRTSNILVERGQLGRVVRRVPSAELGELLSVGGVFDDSELDVFAEFFPE